MSDSDCYFPTHRLVSIDTHNALTAANVAGDDEVELIFHFRSRVIGAGIPLRTPFGEFPLRYFDYVASGRFHRDIEDELNERVLPYMANTHSETSEVGRIITRYYVDAFQKIGRYVRATDDDVLIPVGSGSTGAINRMINILALRTPSWVTQTHPFGARPPLVIRSLMEHHSNDIAWRETVAETVYVEFDEHGELDLNHLESILVENAGTRLIIGTFSAASNVTGIRCRTKDVAKLLHKHGALAFFDFAAAAPHVEIDMNASDESYYDAVFISTHKFVGGPRTPGLLIAKRKLFTNQVPCEPGGGTVLYTSPWDHRYLPDIAARETGGTPPIVQSIQAGLVFDLKARFGVERAEKIEQSYLKRAVARWQGNPNLLLLGSFDIDRVGVISLAFSGLHHEFAVALLNDHFGIQARGGCMCAGPYGHELLKIDEMQSKFIRDLLDHGRTAAKPGWVRISLSCCTTEEDFAILLDAVEFVASEGHKFISEYEYHECGNSWIHRSLSHEKSA